VTKFSDDTKVQAVCDALNRHGLGQYVSMVRELEFQREALRRLAEVFVPAGVNVELTPWQREALNEAYRIGALQ
jgi:predicted DNA binding protein